MTLEKFQLAAILRRFHRSESGTALTEFAITLPVYILFTVGIINLYNMQQDVLNTHQVASGKLWAEAIPVQTSYKPLHMAPAVGAGVSASYYNAIGETVSFASGMDMSSAFGLYVDSGLKATAIDTIPGFNVPVSPGPRLMLDPDIMDNSTHAHALMNDNLLASQLSASGFADFVSSMIDLSGARPAVAAGIRYGVVGVYDDTAYASHDSLNNSDPKARYVVSAPTMPEERIVSVLLTRLEMSRGHDRYDKFVAFGIDKAMMEGARSLDVPDVEACADDAQSAAQDYADCCSACLLCQRRARRAMRRAESACFGEHGDPQGTIHDWRSGNF